MKSALYLTIFLAAAAAEPASALGRLADLTVVDRDTGATLVTYFHHGEYWVAGRPGARYAIVLRNRADSRILAVTSVDGINVISGTTAAWDQSGYVFAPGERSEINGWRKSDSEVAAFTFTSIADSYAARTGRPAYVGVIGVALFRERVAPQVFTPAEPAPAPSAPLESEPESLPQAARPFGAMPAPSVSAAAGRPEGMDSSNTDAMASRRELPERAKLGTGHGAREYSYASHTDFARMQPQPNEIIRIRYDSLENLLAMGIVHRGRPMPSPANPFPASPGGTYVPDPPG